MPPSVETAAGPGEGPPAAPEFDGGTATATAVRPAAPARPRPRRRQVALPARATVLPARLALAVGALFAVAIGMRFVSPYALWLDEAQSVAIARLPLPQLFQALREDGSPPLYYLLLHGWMGLVGTGSAAVRTLSGVFSLASLVLTHRLARQVAGRRTAFALVVLLVTSPFAIRYASEARMYSLLFLLVVLGAMALRWVCRSPGVWPVAALGAATGALLLTHVWAFDLLAVVGVLALVELRRQRAVALRVLAGLALGGVLFLPWLPSLLVQLAHTGTPWNRQRGFSVFPVALGNWEGGASLFGWVLGIPLVILCALGVLAVPGLRGQRGVISVALQLRWSRVFLLATSLGTLAVAAVVSLVSKSGVAGRYTVVALPAFLALVALGVAALPTARARGSVLALMAVLGLASAAPTLVVPRTQAGEVARALSAAAPGDLVVFCPDQLGVSVSRLAPPGLRMVVYPDLRAPERVDWTDYGQRNDVRPAAVATAVVQRAAGSPIWVVTGNGYEVPSDEDCRQFAEQIGDVRGNPSVRVTRRTSVNESMKLQRFQADPPR